MLQNIWALKHRPDTFGDIVLSDDIKDYIKHIQTKQEIQHLLFCGPPGTGKTSLAKIIVNDILKVGYLYINASDERGIDVIREKVSSFAQIKSFDGRFKVIILDEMDGLTPDAQRALRNTMEEYGDNVKFICTANYKNRISEPLESRVITFELKPPLKQAVKYCISILTKENIDFTGQEEQLISLVKRSYPDLRQAINLLQKYSRDGKLNIIQYQEEVAFAKDVLNRIHMAKSVVDVREYIIANEIEFGSDYQNLMNGLFEEVFKSPNIPEDKKRSAMLILGDGMYKHYFVMDHEINAFCSIIKLYELIKA